MSSDFAVTHEDLGDGLHVVAVVGEIDLFTAPDLKAVLGEITQAGARGVVIDLTATTFLDSTGLGVLIGALKRLRAADGELAVVNVDASIARTLEITGLDQIFVVVGERDEALAALRA